MATSRSLASLVAAFGLVAATFASSVRSAEVKTPPSKAATPIEIPKPKPEIKKTPSKKATPIEIPKPKPEIKKAPTAVKKQPSVKDLPVPLPKEGTQPK